jgi:hypothetical protein
MKEIVNGIFFVGAFIYFFMASLISISFVAPLYIPLIILSTIFFSFMDPLIQLVNEEDEESDEGREDSEENKNN